MFVSVSGPMGSIKLACTKRSAVWVGQRRRGGVGLIESFAVGATRLVSFLQSGFLIDDSTQYTGEFAFKY